MHILPSLANCNIVKLRTEFCLMIIGTWSTELISRYISATFSPREIDSWAALLRELLVRIVTRRSN